MPKAWQWFRGRARWIQITIWVVVGLIAVGIVNGPEAEKTTDVRVAGAVTDDMADEDLTPASTTSTTTSTTVATTTSLAPTTTTTTSTSTPPPTAPPPPANCDPNYSGCVPIDSDVDCLGGSGNGPSYVPGPVQVIGSDIYGLDADNDGLGCE